MFIICRPYFKLKNAYELNSETYFINDALNYQEVNDEIMWELRKYFPEPEREIKRLGETNIYKIDTLKDEIMRGVDSLPQMLNYFRILAEIGGAPIKVTFDKDVSPIDCKLYFDSFNDNEPAEGFTDDHVAEYGSDIVGTEQHLTGMDLQGLILNRTTIIGMSFANSNLTGSLFEHCNLMCTDFTNTILSNCNFKESDIRGSLFNGSEMNTREREGIWTMIIDCKASYCDFSNAEMRYCILNDSEFLESKFNSTALIGAEMQRAQLMLANLEDAHLRLANLTGAQLADAKLINTHLENSNLADTDLAGADLTDAHLTGATLSRAYIFMSKLIRANLTNAHLSRAQIVGTDLTNAKLIGATLTDADLTRSNLTGADLTDANLNDTNLYEAVLQDTIYGVNINDAVYEANPGEEQEDLQEDLQDYVLDGPAFEIHNAFNKINIGKFMELISLETGNVNITYETLPEFINSNFKTFIEKHDSFSSEDKPKYIGMLEKIIDKLTSGNSLPKDTVTKIAKTITFAFKQPDNVIENYIRSFIKDSYYAYKNDDQGYCQSCIDGIIERFISILGETLDIYCLENECNDIQIKAVKVIKNTIDINDFTQAWFENVESNKSQYLEMSASERKQDYIEFMTKKYQEAGFYNDENKMKIKTEADNLNYVFESDDISYGGNKKHKTTKKHKKNKTTKKHKKHKNNKTNKKT